MDKAVCGKQGGVFNVNSLLQVCGRANGVREANGILFICSF
ncbi:hypothetical protein [Petroclostridium sp. X23]|nr:hypothetical protein [Petroclostridium sp. X23]WHH58594.1 hypothetical protein QKW49_22820 [Petroclostridium sp. X23]